MDYGRMGSAKYGKNKPRHADRDGKGAPKSGSKRPSKAELLERMKAAANKEK